MKTLFEDSKLRAELDGTDIKLTYKEAGKTTRISALTCPKPITDVKLIASLRQKGIDPATRSMMGPDACMATEAANQIITAAREDPEVQFKILRDGRGKLAMEIGCLVEENHERHVRFIEKASEHGTCKTPKDMTAEIEAARGALKAFDAVHPEIKARIDAEKQESYERNMWN